MEYFKEYIMWRHQEMKKIIAFLLALVTLISLGVPAFASEAECTSDSPYADYNEETEREIDILIQNLVKLRFESVHAKNSTSSVGSASEEANIFDALRDLGVKIVGEDNLSTMETDRVGQAVASSSSFFEGFNTKYNDFFVTGPLRRRHGRSGYHVVTVRVVPKNASSVLGNASITTVSLYSSKKPLVSFVKNACSIYAQKAIGQIPVVRWLPYEYLFADWSDSDVNKTQATYVINVNSATTAKYIYIANTDVENEASYKLSLLDHSVSYHEVHNSSYTKNGVAGSKVAENDYVIEGDYYSSPDSQAYQNFLNGDYEKLKAPSAKYYEENSTGKEVLKHTVSAKSGLYSPYNY